MNACINCKHCHTYAPLFEFAPIRLCWQPHVVKKADKTDPVTGKVRYSRQLLDPSYQRDSGGICGPDGAFFEAANDASDVETRMVTRGFWFWKKQVPEQHHPRSFNFDPETLGVYY